MEIYLQKVTPGFFMQLFLRSAQGLKRDRVEIEKCKVFVRDAHLPAVNVQINMILSQRVQDRDFRFPEVAILHPVLQLPEETEQGAFSDIRSYRDRL